MTYRATLQRCSEMDLLYGESARNGSIERYSQCNEVGLIWGRESDFGADHFREDDGVN